SAQEPVLDDRYAWTAGDPIIRSDALPDADWIAMKDPSIVYYDGLYHTFFTVRDYERSHGLAYLSFADFVEADASQAIMMPHHDGYAAAPQVFYFSPHERWYMVAQTRNPEWDPPYQAAYATTTDIAHPTSWSEMKPMEVPRPEDNRYLDFWVIADDAKMHLFFTSDNGNMWREETALADFPYGWTEPVLAQQTYIFEASHIYKVNGTDQFINVIEATLPGDRRYFKLYAADALDGAWSPIAADSSHALAAMNNVAFEGERWTDSISHGELVRSGYDEAMEVDGDDYTFIYQGVPIAVRSGLPYGEIPWSIGVLREVE
ncbi:MAG: non-reducing end alpha-L-arabinofuranosidase family hydrolase, partial [Bacteroidota bacterium]